MKIVNVDNYDRDTESDKLICNDISQYYGEHIVKFLNDMVGGETEDYFKLKEDDYELYKWKP